MVARSELHPRLANLPAPVLNGIGVGLGLACLTTLIGLTAGMPAAITAASGAAATSVADTVCAPQAKRAQMFPAVLSSTAVASLVALCHPSTLTMTAALLSTIFVSVMWMSWGKRGGPQTFVMVLTLVFQMSALKSQAMQGAQVWQHLAWVLTGSLGMAAWAMLSGRWLAQRYRTLALADSLDALARMVQAQAQWTSLRAPTSPSSEPLKHKHLLTLIGQQAGVAEVFQNARDLLYSQAQARQDDPLAQRQIQSLIHAVNLRDVVLACQLDLDRLPAQPDTDPTVTALVAQLERHATELKAMAQAWRSGERLTPQAPPTPALADTAMPRELQAPIKVSLLRRKAHMQSLVALIQDELNPTAPPGAHASATHTNTLLSLVSPTHWGLAPLKAQLHGHAPVLRYAIRATLAVGCADAIAHALPWASHPQWILMTVAVVMRGNLEQTLARRDARIQGTLVGCLLASAILYGAGPHVAWLFLALAVSLSLAHGYVMLNYRVTAAAGAVLALVQTQLFNPGHHPALLDAMERLGDTLIGAALAWGFSYVLPSWERRHLPMLVNRLIRAQAHYVQHALRWHEQHAQTPRRSHARREVYDVLGLVSQSLLRMGKEPRHARAWGPDLERVLIHSHRFIGQLAAVKGLLTAQHGAWHGEQFTAVLAQCEQRVLATLAGDLDEGRGMATPSSTTMETGAETIPVDGAIMTDTHEQALMAWLVNRLTETEQAAQSLAHAARAFRQHAAP